MVQAPVDPNLFHVDWDRLTDVLVAIIVLSFFVERALALVFENRKLVERLSGSGIKEWIALAVAFLICWRWGFDAVSLVTLEDKTSVLGELVTAGVIAGGSKASIRFFHDLLGVKSTALKEYQALRAAEAESASNEKSGAPRKTQSKPAGG